jgi:hypothetical protein
MVIRTGRDWIGCNDVDTTMERVCVRIVTTNSRRRTSYLLMYDGRKVPTAGPRPSRGPRAVRSKVPATATIKSPVTAHDVGIVPV